MSPANEEMLDVMRYISAVSAYIDDSIFLDSTLAGAPEFAIYRSKVGEGCAFPPG